MVMVTTRWLVDVSKDKKRPPGISYILANMFIAEHEVDLEQVSFRSLPIANDIMEWAERHGFDDRLDDMLTMQAAIDYPMDGVRLRWAITLPDQETLMLFRLGVDLNG